MKAPDDARATLLCTLVAGGTGAPAHSFDRIYVLGDGLMNVAEAKPGDEAVLGHLLLKAPAVAQKMGLSETGFRLVINNGRDAGEAVPHLHCHILGGRPMGWPPG